MAQAPSFKPSIHYQVCNSTADHEASHLSTIKPAQQISPPVFEEGLYEIKVSPPTKPKTSSQLSAPNHYASTLKPLTPLKSSAGSKLSSVGSTTLTKPIQPSSSSSHLAQNTNDSCLSIQSLQRGTSTQHRSSLNSSVHSANRQSPSRQSIFDTLATTLTAVRKSSTSALALAQQRLSTDNGNLFSAYQGKLCNIILSINA